MKIFWPGFFLILAKFFRKSGFSLPWSPNLENSIGDIFSSDTQDHESITHLENFYIFPGRLKHFGRPLQVKISKMIKTGASGTGILKSENCHFIWIEMAYDPPKLIFWTEKTLSKIDVLSLPGTGLFLMIPHTTCMVLFSIEKILMDFVIQAILHLEDNLTYSPV